MTQKEIKKRIVKIEKQILDTKHEWLKVKLNKGLKQYEAKLEPEKKKITVKPKKKVVVPKKKVGSKQSAVKKTKTLPKPSTKTPMLDKALRTNKQIPDKITITKGKKAESHTTTFGKDIEGAIVVLNKERFVIKEIKDRKTKKVNKVKHTAEYNNAKTIEKRVGAIFNSSIYDIAKTKAEKKEKAVFIGTINEVKDLTTLFLNEIDSIINNGNNTDMQAIKTLMLRLIKEAQKNDPSDKYKSAGNLDKIIKKFNLADESKQKDMKKIILTLESVPNPDHDYNTEKSKKIKIKEIEVKSIDEAKTKFQSFIDENDLGGGNLTKKSGQIHINDKFYGEISYNGRLWDKKNNEIK